MARKGQTEAAAVRRLKSLDLRIEGKSYRTIAAVLGVDPKTAWNDVDKIMSEIKDITREKAEHLRTIELERLDRLHDALWNMALSGGKNGTPSLFAVDRVLAVMTQRAKLLGLDAPIKQETQGTQEIIVRYADDTPQDDEKTE